MYDNNYNENNTGNSSNSGGNYSSMYQKYSGNEKSTYDGNTKDYSKNTYDYDRSSYSKRTYDYDDGSRKKKSGGKVLLAVLGITFLVGAGTAAGVVIGSKNLLPMGQKTEAPEAAPIPEMQREPEALIQKEGASSSIESTQQVTAIITDVTDVVEEVMPSVVSITNTSVVTQNFWGQQFTSENNFSGSGFIVGENENELLIVTNNHVIADSTELKVQFIDETVATAKVKGTDSSMDLAVLAVSLDQLDPSTRGAISIATLGDSETLKVGEPAIAIGNALGYGQSVTTGVISALNRQIMVEDGSTSGSLIQTDAAINPGNSGGALLNVKGEVVGINSNKMGGTVIEGMGYAIPISRAKPIIQELMSRETKDKVAQERKGYLGISGLDVTSEVSAMYGMPLGVYIAQVYEGGAGKAGLMKGDIITAFDGSTVRTMEELQGYLEYYEIGSTVLVTVQRPSAGGYMEYSVLVTLGQQVRNP